MKSVGVERKTEADLSADDRENVKQGPPLPKGVMKSNLFNRIELPFPPKRPGQNLTGFVIRGEVNGNGGLETLDHRLN